MFTKLAAFSGNLQTDNHGQDIIEYSLLSGFVAVAAAATLPDISSHVTTIFTVLNTQLSQASAAAS